MTGCGVNARQPLRVQPASGIPWPIRNSTEDQRHEAPLERRCDCCRARDCLTCLGAADRSGRRCPWPQSTGPGRAWSLVADVQLAAELLSGSAISGTTARGRGGSRIDGRYQLRDAARAPSRAPRRNSPCRKGCTSSVGNDRRLCSSVEPGRVGPPAVGQLLHAAGSAAAS